MCETDARPKIFFFPKRRLFSTIRGQLLFISFAVFAVTAVVYKDGSDPYTFFFGARGADASDAGGRRLLSAGSSCGTTPDWEKKGGIVAYILGVFFMFLGIAIVCDDFFVASLEKICEVLRLSDDVAGATFMAAGSSAPELASSAMSLINPNAGSEIGVGTIVGSAIFNILVIIGATVCATGNTLKLDWKPITRDCFFYAAAIAGIVGTFAGGRVDWWEGGVYVAFYATYIVTMMYNERLMRWLDSLERSDKVQAFKRRLSYRTARDQAAAYKATHDGAGPAEIVEKPEEEEPSSAASAPSDDPIASPRTADVAEKAANAILAREEKVALELRSSGEGAQKAKAMWGKIRKTVVKHQMANVVLEAAKQWRAKEHAIDADAPGATLGVPEPAAERSIITPTMTPGHIRKYRADAIHAARTLAARDKILAQRAAQRAAALEEGTASALDDAESDAADAGEEEDDGSPWDVPEDKKDWPLWALSLPWYAAFQLTIPPCGDSRWEKWYVVSFVMSIVWIGFITHWMVEWCVRIGCILNVPSVVMGTTVLAAGTSIPDALSSIAVAKDGLADMAVANAVGSNVFDIWLGLGLPWLLYVSWQDPNYIEVSTDELVPSALILAGVLVLYYGSVALNGFNLTVRMGYMYMATYVVYALYSIILVWLLDIYDLEKKK